MGPGGNPRLSQQHTNCGWVYASGSLVWGCFFFPQIIILFLYLLFVNISREFFPLMSNVFSLVNINHHFVTQTSASWAILPQTYFFLQCQRATPDSLIYVGLFLATLNSFWFILHEENPVCQNSFLEIVIGGLQNERKTSAMKLTAYLSHD